MAVLKVQDVAVDPVLPPAGLVSVHYRTATDALQNPAHFRSCLPGNLVDGTDDGPKAQFQLMHRSQIPLDGPYGQPALFPQGHDQAHQVGSKTLTARGQTLQRVLGQPPFPAQGTRPGYEDVFCDLHRRAAGSSMTSLVRCAQPPLRVVWHSGQDPGVWTTRRVAFIRGRAKPWGRFRRGFFSCSGIFLRLAAGLWPGIPTLGPAADSRASRLSTHCRSSALVSCSSAITASRVSRLALVRSSPVSIVLLCHNHALGASVFQRNRAAR